MSVIIHDTHAPQTHTYTHIHTHTRILQLYLSILFITCKIESGDNMLCFMLVLAHNVEDKKAHTHAFF